MIHHLHDVAGVHPAQVGQELEAEGGLIVERGQDLGDVARCDAHLGLVVTLPDGTKQAIAKAAFEAGLERAIHSYRSSGTVGPIARSGQWPRRSLTSCWSFIIP